MPGAKGQTELQPCECRQESRPSFAKASADGAYQSELRDLIYLLKYEAVLPAARIPGRVPVDVIDKLELVQKPILAVPGPLHASKKRGFNRSKMIAQAVSRKFGSANLQLARSVLVCEHILASETAGSECPRFLRKAPTRNVSVNAVARSLKETDALLEIEAEFEDAAQAW